MKANKLIDISERIHQNAVEHGWWETDRSIDETFVLIHSEWSEALEAARNNEPIVVWHEKGEACGICPNQTDSKRCEGVSCPYGHKPEGIGV